LTSPDPSLRSSSHLDFGFVELAVNSFVPNAPVFDKPPSFGKRQGQISDLLYGRTSHVTAEIVQQDQAVQQDVTTGHASVSTLASTVKAAVALIGDALKKVPFNPENATMVVDTVGPLLFSVGVAC
jgi:hypothetical protein